MIVYFNEVLCAIGNALNSIVEQSFEQLVDESIDTLRAGGRIIATGLGKNVAICEKFVGTLVSLGENACFLHTNSAMHGDIGIVKENDLVIMLTKSGETVESIYLSKLLKQRKANIWLLSFSKNSTLFHEIDNKIIMELEEEGDMWNIIPNNSTVVNLILLQSLAMYIAKKKGIALDEFKKNHPGGYIGQLFHS